jgi:hypothetical protein
MLNNLLLAPHHHQVRRSRRSIYCWHGHAAAPYRASGFVQWHFSDMARCLVWVRNADNNGHLGRLHQRHHRRLNRHDGFGLFGHVPAWGGKNIRGEPRHP